MSSAAEATQREATQQVVNPVWLRTWHWVQALCFLGLVTTGLSMHYADANWSFLPFRWAVIGHNALGVMVAVLWVTFMAMNLVSGNVRHYLPFQARALRDVWRQLRHYAWGMFRDEPAPFPYGLGEKFNPMQKLAYVVVMYALLPLSIASGLVLLFPLLVAAHPFGRAGLWPVAMVHLAMGWLMCLFALVHVYLATTGEAVTTLYREMFTGVRHSTFPPAPGPEATRPSSSAPTPTPTPTSGSPSAGSS